MQKPEAKAVKCCLFCQKPLSVKWPARRHLTYCSNAHRAAYNRRKNAPTAEEKAARRHVLKAERRGEVPEGLAAVLEAAQQLAPNLAELIKTAKDWHQTVSDLAEMRQAGEQEKEVVGTEVFLLEAKMLRTLLRYAADAVEEIEADLIDVLHFGDHGSAELDALLYPRQVNYADQADDDQDDDDETDFHNA
jgi:hypothetical protein